MDKETLSNYGWIVICVLVLAVMIALATPFGSFVSDAVKSTTQGLFDVNQSALNSTGLINIDGQSFSEGNNGGAEAPVEPEVPVDPEPTECQHTNTTTINASSATCTTAGYTGDTYCSECNTTTVTGTTIPATGHTTDNGTCGNCGETISQYQLSGTWMFNESVNYPSKNILQDINFTIMESNTECHRMEIGSGWNIVCRYVQPTQSGAMSTTVNYDGVWYLNNRAIDFGSTPQPVSKEFYDWFTVNATQ